VTIMNLAFVPTFDLLMLFSGAMVFANRYVPWFRTKYEPLSPDMKQFWNMVIILGLDLAVVILSALKVVDVYAISSWQVLIRQVGVDLAYALFSQTTTYNSVKHIIYKE